MNDSTREQLIQELEAAKLRIVRLTQALSESSQKLTRESIQYPSASKWTQKHLDALRLIILTCPNTNNYISTHEGMCNSNLLIAN
jgi:hypothetical protein